MDLLRGLNEKQREAASHDLGPILVIAGAGTGKTRVLTHRISNLINTGKARPGEILSITFTNKAAKEMKERISQLIDYNVDRMWIGTFHSICVRILRRDIERLGYDRNFVIYDTDDQKNLIKTCIKELNLDTKKYNANTIKGVISNEKNLRNTPEKYMTENFANFVLRNYGEVFSLYEKKLKICNALDFDDLILKALKLLQTNSDIKEYYQERFKYILVDEYQDTNNVQYNLVKILGKKSNGQNNVFVVGDDDQSIYGWRGADISNILDFEKDFENAKVVKLERNYRSTSIILNAANSVIKNNFNRKGKELYTDDDDGDLITLINTDNEKEEAFMIASNIKKEYDKNDIPYSEIAILYRANAQSRALEEGLITLGIPYKIVGGLKFYGRKEIKDIMAYLMLIQNSRDDINFMRIINLPRRKIGPKAIASLSQYATEQQISLFEACYDAKELEIPAAGIRGIESFIQVMEMLMVKKDVLSLYEFIEAVYKDTKYEKMIEEDQSIEGMSRLENIQEFLSAAKDFEERYEENALEDFLAHVALLSDTDKTDETENERVTLLTVHSAKGLEYDVVLVAGLEEMTFPIIRDGGIDEDLEEERRLFYVAATRAKKRLYLSYSNERMVYGRHEMRGPSRFIEEIPAKYLDRPVSKPYSKESKYKKSSGDFDDYFNDGEMSFNSFSKSKKKNHKNSLFTGNSFINEDIKVRDVYDDLKAEDLKSNLDDISNSGIKEISIDQYLQEQPVKQTTNLKSDKMMIGDKIKHKAWGIGTIVSLVGEGKDLKATIAFDEKGLKTVMMSFAPIEKI
ncbi:UvrD-helicase domain-containing protein [Sedimentibacter sp. zth1]|uniref:ATP-dependent helicase n=1 Tax=Sedimentibacter sp. zth1 TaxID=2816908 RepID=UPI001A933C4D|nr:UvrD-helicase domain-containing protein [Sedimentibacter sp. zth1]QSX05100.1 UvrD-helicase domain-containing protein [Sedimentibacter sp. zth1]